MKNKNYNPFYTNENDLSTRSLQVMERLGGTEQMLQHYKTFKTFLNIKKAGVLVNKELSFYCQYLLEMEKQLIPEVMEQISMEDFEKLLYGYQLEKQFLPIKVKNILTKTEYLADFNDSMEDKLEFFRKYFLKSLNFKVIRGVGSKTIIDLKNFTQVVLNYKNLDDNFFNNTNLNVAEPPKSLTDHLNLLFNDNYSPQELASFVNGESYKFQRVLILLLNTSFNETQTNIYWYYYFEKEHFTYTGLANKLFFSKELVRVYIKNFEDKILNKLCAKIKNRLGDNYSDIPPFDNSHFLNLDNFENFEFDGKVYTPNFKLMKLVYTCFLGDDYIHFEQLIKESVEYNKSFDLKEQNLFLTKIFVETYKIQGLLNYLNKEIFNFEITESDYDLAQLVYQFFTKNSIEINNSIITSICEELILKVKKVEWDFYAVGAKNQRKKKYRKMIIDYTYNYLKECNSVQKTRPILENLAKNKMIVDRFELMNILCREKSKFIKFGLGVWGLTDWQIGLDLKGSIRQIVVAMLQANELPIHISEIHETINKIRPISFHSLDTNLRADIHDTFKFFNCSYIGLSKKKYDKYWKKIPRFYSLKAIKNRIKNQNFETLADEIDFIIKKFGYPKKHLEYKFAEKLNSN